MLHVSIPDEGRDIELMRSILTAIRNADPLEPLESILSQIEITTTEVDDLKKRNPAFEESLAKTLRFRNQKATGILIYQARQSLLERISGQSVRERAATERTEDGTILEIKERFYPADIKAILHVLDTLDPLFKPEISSENIAPPVVKFMFFNEQQGDNNPA